MNAGGKLGVKVVSGQERLDEVNTCNAFENNISQHCRCLLLGSSRLRISGGTGSGVHQGVCMCHIDKMPIGWRRS